MLNSDTYILNENHNKKGLSLRYIQDNHLNLSPLFWNRHCTNLCPVKATYFMPFSGQGFRLPRYIHIVNGICPGNWWGLHLLKVKQSGKMSSWSLTNFISVCYRCCPSFSIVKDLLLIQVHLTIFNLLCCFRLEGLSFGSCCIQSKHCMRWSLMNKENLSLSREHDTECTSKD